jgi:Skp family chaperone for outer membrane proteins
MCAAAVWAAKGWAAESQRVAVVNVSYLFEKYDKVGTVQTRIDAAHEEQKKELESRGQAMANENQQFESQYRSAGNTPEMFDKVQMLRKRQYLYEREVQALNAQIQKDYTREMKEVLSDIRQAINTYAEAQHFDMVFRSPDTDDPDVTPSTETMKSPAADDNKTYLQKLAPKTMGELLERFNRNPVLFGATTVDITQPVLLQLNLNYQKRAAPRLPVK